MAIVYMNNQQSTINSAFVGENKIIAIYYNNQLLYNFSGIDTISYLLDRFTGFRGNSRMKAFKIRKVSSFENIAKEISDSLANTLVDYEKEITDIKKLLGYRDNGKEKVGVGTGLPPEYLSESGINSLADKVNVLNELVSRIMDALGLSS